MLRRVGERTFVKQPVRFSTYADIAERPPPRLGEHTETVLAECGYSPEEIAAMRAEGAI